jgi:hypothetical protein
MLYCSMYNLSVDEFRCQDFVPKDWEALSDPGLGILFCLRDGTLTDPRKGSLLDYSRTCSK